jgi:hypothetical protein
MIIALVVYPARSVMPPDEYFSLARVCLNSTNPEVHLCEIESSFHSCKKEFFFYSS